MAKSGGGIRPVTGYGLKGMSNIPQPVSPLVDQERRMTPHYAVNCDILDSGVVKQAEGYQMFLGLPGLHSIGGEELGLDVLLGVATGKLYRINANGTARELANIGADAAMTYAEIGNRIYCSTAFWHGVYNLSLDRMEAWGVEPPSVAPDVALIPGDMPPGKYAVCYTRHQDGYISGNGPIRFFEFADNPGGLQFNNLEDDYLCWITQVNGGTMFLSQVNGIGQLTAQVPNITPLTSLNIAPPPPFAHFAYFAGRIWGVSGKNLYYSEPNELGDFGWFSHKAIPFLEDLVMVAPYNTGLFVASRTATWDLPGSDPEKMEVLRVGTGAIPGSLTYAQVPAKLAGGAVPTQAFGDLSMMPTPVWRSPTGFVVGTHKGHLTLITERKVKMSARQQGASIFRWQEGVPQVVMTTWGVAQNQNTETQAIMHNGRLFEK